MLKRRVERGEVHGIGASPEMIAVATAKARAENFGTRPKTASGP